MVSLDGQLNCLFISHSLLIANLQLFFLIAADLLHFWLLLNCGIQIQIFGVLRAAPHNIARTLLLGRTDSLILMSLEIDHLGLL